MWVDFEEVEEGIGGVGVVSAKGLETELTVHEDDSVARFEEVFGRGCTTGT